jgi:superfamily II DNA or RNA helicase
MLSGMKGIPSHARNLALASMKVAEQCWKAGDPDGALSLLDEVVFNVPKFVQAHRMIVRILVTERYRTSDVIAAMRAIHEADCAEPVDELNLGVALYRERSYAEALPLLERAFDGYLASLPGWGYAPEQIARHIAMCRHELGLPPPDRLRQTLVMPLPGGPGRATGKRKTPKPTRETGSSKGHAETGRAAPSKGERTDAAEPAAEPESERVASIATGVRIEEAPEIEESFSRGALSDLGKYLLALDGAALAQAERYDTLLGLAGMTGVQKYAYQIETARRVLRSFRGRVLLADEVGLGKTIEAGMILREYVTRGMVKKALVLAPTALVGQWCEELCSKFGLSPVSTEALGARGDPEQFWKGNDLIVASLALARNQIHAPLLADIDYDLVIVDEAHNIRNIRTAGWMLVNSLKSRFLVLISATPVENNLTDMYGLVTLLRPGQFGTLAAFKRQFVSRKDPTQPLDRERLRALLGEVMIRNTRALADVKLPPRHATTVIVDSSPEDREFYERLTELVRDGIDCGLPRVTLGLLLQEAGSSYEAVARTLLVISQRPDQGGARGARIEELIDRCRKMSSSGKLSRLLDILRLSREKTLVFTRFTATLRAIEHFLSQAGVAFSVFAGGMSAADKDQAVLRFREDVDVMLCSEVGGEGQNMQFASSMINFDLPWNPMRIEQRIGRIHRIGQTRPVSVFNLCASGTAEQRILEVLDKKINMFELVIGEIDTILGQLKGEEDFEERVLAIYGRSRDDDEVARAFETLAEEISEARERYEKIKILDQTIFCDDYQV